MTPRDLPFVANSPGIGGTVTRFAIVNCRLDPPREVAVMKVALEWVLSVRSAELGEGALATPWKASFYLRDKSGQTVTVAEVEVSAADAVQEQRDQRIEYRFQVEAEFGWQLSQPNFELEATIRRVEQIARSPVADLLGYANAPDLDGTFEPEVIGWLQRMNFLAGGHFEKLQAPASARPVAPAPQAPIARPVEPPDCPVASCEAIDDPVEAKPADAKPADAAVFCPPSVGRATTFLVQTFLYPPAQAEVARVHAREADAGADRRGALSLPLDLPRDTRIDLRLEMPGLRVDEPDAMLVWRDALASVQFEVAVPEDLTPGAVIGRIRFSIAGVPCGTLRFQVIVTARATSEPAGAADVAVRRYRRAFVSYSSTDRAEVLRRVQAFRIAGLSVFQDVLDLEPGERWERELYREIDICDVVLLFWSRAAAESPWVAREIDYALARKQGQEDRPPDIQPVPIEGPPIPAPPEKLRHLHFNDALLAHIAAAQSAGKPHC